MTAGRSDTEALAELADVMQQILETAAGHKARAETAGFSPTVAERMALHAHALLVTILRDATTRNNQKDTTT